MRCICGELRHSLYRDIEATQHTVQRLRQTLELVRCLRHLQPARQIADTNRFGCSCYLIHWLQCSLTYEITSQPCSDQKHRRRKPENQTEAFQSLVKLVQGRGDLYCVRMAIH